MATIFLPEVVAAWSEAQVATGRAANVGSYLTQLIAEDHRRQQRLAERRAAMTEARASGISMEPADSVLARLRSSWAARRTGASVERLRAAIAEGRASGTSLAALDGILARALRHRIAHAA